MPVNPEVFKAHDEWFVAVAKKIQDGTAKTQERRAWYEMKKRYFPFTPDAIPPKNWRVEALKKGDLLDPRLNPKAGASMMRVDANGGVRPQAATDYNWTPIGAGTHWSQGQPPAAAPNDDRGGGRTTAIWVNPNDKRDVLLGFADSGVWKNTNMSATENDPLAVWTPITDFQPSLSVGSVVARVSALDANRLGPNSTIWVATGE